jgi:hypothetical protein
MSDAGVASAAHPNSPARFRRERSQLVSRPDAAFSRDRSLGLRLPAVHHSATPAKREPGLRLELTGPAQARVAASFPLVADVARGGIRARKSP